MENGVFWTMIERTSSLDRSQHADSLVDELARMSPKEIVSFDEALQERISSANVGDLWAAATLMNGGHCSDDCWLYFRCWLVSQGQRTYTVALRDPDSLAGLVTSMKSEQRRDFQFEELGYVVTRAYEKATGGKSITRATRKRKELDEESAFDWRIYSNEVLAERLPALWAIFGNEKIVEDQKRDARVARLLNNVEKVEIPGVGVIKVGSKVIHKDLGLGTVKGLAGGLVTTAVIAFPDGERSIVLLGDAVKPVVE
jgi:Protein of unknown function (DUF4240)